MGAEALAVSEKHRFKNAVISGRFCREDSNLAPSKNSSHHFSHVLQGDQAQGGRAAGLAVGETAILLTPLPPSLLKNLIQEEGGAAE